MDCFILTIYYRLSAFCVVYSHTRTLHTCNFITIAMNFILVDNLMCVVVHGNAIIEFKFLDEFADLAGANY